MYFEKLIIEFILYLFLPEILTEDCLTHSLTDLNFPKVKTLVNGYHLMVTSKGIYSFNPELTNIAFSYNFTDEQTFSTDITKMQNTINQVEISQFIENEGRNYVICIANNYFYFMDEYGKMVFNQKLTKNINIDYPINLISYKYSNGFYYFIIAHNYFDNRAKIYFYYYKIIDESSINLEYETPFNLAIVEQNQLNLQTLSCEALISQSYGKVLACFTSTKYYNSYLIASFFLIPEQNFLFLFLNQVLQEPDNSEVKLIKTSVNDEKTKEFACYSIDSPNKVKCFYYNVNENKIYNIFVIAEYCNTNFYGFNIYYFKDSKEYIISCINKDKNNFSMKRIDNNFNIIQDNNSFFKKENLILVQIMISFQLFIFLNINNIQQ